MSKITEKKKKSHIQNDNHNIFHDLPSHIQHQMSKTKISFPLSFSKPIKIFWTHKFIHTNTYKNFAMIHEIKFTHNSQVSYMHHPSLQYKFFTMSMPQNLSQNSSDNITNYQHYQNSISHQHCPNYTMNYLHSI